MWPRIVKVGLYSGVATLAGTVGIPLVSEDYNTLAVVRILRTAATAIDIGKTYRSMLYTKEWDSKSREYLEIRSKAHDIGAKKLLELCQANKGVYVKIGQHIGALDYLLPQEYVNTLKVLHKDAPKNTVEQIYNVIRQELKKEPQELFDEFEPEPLGTASLAQVHRAKLKDGTDVAVKVQHYFVRKSMKVDIIWIEFVINCMAKVFPEFEMQWLVDETKKNIEQELNFLNEGKNSEKIADHFMNYKWFKVPKIFWKYSTERVLVMEYVDGGQISDLNYIDANKIDKEDLCRKLGDLYSHMIFVNGFVHSDPHPGNILVKQGEGSIGTMIYLLDHGLCAQLTDQFRYNYSKLWLSIINRDKQEMETYSVALGIRKELFGLFAVMVSGRSWDTILKGIDKTKRTAEEKASMQDELPFFVNLITECLEHVDRQALLVLKTNDLLRSIEFTLGLQDKMCSFLVMTKCCITSVYEHEYKNSEGFQRNLVQLKYRWSILLLYLYGIFLSLTSKLKFSWEES